MWEAVADWDIAFGDCESCAINFNFRHSLYFLIILAFLCGAYANHLVLCGAPFFQRFGSFSSKRVSFIDEKKNIWSSSLFLKIVFYLARKLENWRAWDFKHPLNQRLGELAIFAIWIKRLTSFLIVPDKGRARFKSIVINWGQTKFFWNSDNFLIVLAESTYQNKRFFSDFAFNFWGL